MRRLEFIAVVGGAAAWPLAARAQVPEGVRHIGVLITSDRSDPEGQARIASFRDALQRLGWVEGRNVQIDDRWPGDDAQRIRREAADLVDRHPDVIFLNSQPAFDVMGEATSTIPVVFVQVTDPVVSGLVKSLARPGGNLTGFSNYGSTGGKMLELLREMSPAAHRVAVLHVPGSASNIANLDATNAAAAAIGAELISAKMVEFIRDLLLCRERRLGVVWCRQQRTLRARCRIRRPHSQGSEARRAADPAVFRIGGDPIASGLVPSLNRPGGNVTGITTLGVEQGAKRLQILSEVLPAGAGVALLTNPTNANAARETAEIEVAARLLGIRLAIFNCTTPDDIEAAFTGFAAQNISGLMTAAEPLFFKNLNRVVALAARYATPAVYSNRFFVEAGGLMGYGVDGRDGHRLTGVYTGRVLDGEKPADLPVQQSTKIELIINLKTAKALSLTVPLPLLGRADEVIE